MEEANIERRRELKVLVGPIPADIKIRITDAIPRRISVIDLIRWATASQNPRDVYRDISERYPEVVAISDTFMFPGAGQNCTVISCCDRRMSGNKNL